MGSARQNPPVFLNPAGFVNREDLRIAATSVGWGWYTANNPATAIQLTAKRLLRHVQDLAGFAVKSVRQSLEGPMPRIDVDLDADPRHRPAGPVVAAGGRVSG